MKEFFKKLIWKLGSTNGLHLTEVAPWGDTDEMYRTCDFYATYETDDVLKALYEDRGLDIQEFKKLNKGVKLQYCTHPCSGMFEKWTGIFVRKAV